MANELHNIEYHLRNIDSNLSSLEMTLSNLEAHQADHGTTLYRIADALEALVHHLESSKASAEIKGTD